MASLNTPRTKLVQKKNGIRRSFVPDSAVLSTTESVVSNARRIDITDENHDSVVFVWFDSQEQSNINLVGPLRAINDSVQAFTDLSSCCEAIRSSKEQIFFISSSSNIELVTTVHDFAVVEAIFILNPNIENIRGFFPKLFGIFSQQEELFRVVKEIYDAFEQIQLEVFVFEEDKVFLWSQLWKEEVSQSIL
jgi:hypothetical protein